MSFFADAGAASSSAFDFANFMIFSPFHIDFRSGKV